MEKKIRSYDELLSEAIKATVYHDAHKILCEFVNNIHGFYTQSQITFACELISKREDEILNKNHIELVKAGYI